MCRPPGGSNVPRVDPTDPPSARALVRAILGVALALAVVAFVVVLIDSRQIPWKFAALILALWGARSALDAMFGSVFEPFGRFLEDALTGGATALPGEEPITIDEEMAILERGLAADPPPIPHRAILMGIRLAEIYRTRQHDDAKADAVIARLATQYPDAPELKYVRRN